MIAALSVFVMLTACGEDSSKAKTVQSNQVISEKEETSEVPTVQSNQMILETEPTSEACLTPVVRADDLQEIVNSINRVTGGYDLTATISDNTVIVTGTLLGTPSTSDYYLTLNINAGITVIWQATLSGSSSRALINISDGSGVFELQSGGSIENTGSGSAIINNSSCTVNIADGVVKAIEASTISNDSTGIINVSGGTVSVVHGQVIRGWSSLSYNSAIYNSTGTVNVSDGTVNVLQDGGYAISSYGSSMVNVSGGIVSATNGTAIFFNSSGTLKIEGGTVRATTRIAISISNNVKVEGRTVRSTTCKAIVSGGTVASDGNAIFIEGGTLEVSGNAKIISANTSRGIITANGTIHVAGGVLNINDGTVENTTSGVAIYNSDYQENYMGDRSPCGTINVNGGTILAGGNAIYSKGGAVNISGGTVSTSNGKNPVIEYNGNLKITGGTISANANVSVITYFGYVGGNYKLTLGGNPTITGKIVTAPEKLSVLTTDTEAFAPGQKTYTLSFEKYAAGDIAVMNGREFLSNFRLNNPDWVLTGSAAHLSVIPANR